MTDAPLAFKDTKGRDYIVEVNVAAIKRVKSMLGVDLMTLVDNDADLLKQLVSDPILLVDVIYVVVKPHADQHGLDDEGFGAAMAGDCIEAASNALLKGLVGFFPNPTERNNLTKVLRAVDRAMAKARELTEARLSDETALDKMIDEAVASVDPIAGDSSTGAQGSSDSTPGR